MHIEEAIVSPPYWMFWNCLTGLRDCSLFNNNPHLLYFGISLASLYLVLLLVVLGDLVFWWTPDSLQQQVDYYVTFIKKKLKSVTNDKLKPISIKDRTEALIRECKERSELVTAVHAAIKRKSFTCFHTEGQQNQPNSNTYEWEKLLDDYRFNL